MEFAGDSRGFQFDFVNVYQRRYEDNKGGKTYSLSQDAQQDYDDLVDSFAEFLN